MRAKKRPPMGHMDRLVVHRAAEVWGVRAVSILQNIRCGQLELIPKLQELTNLLWQIGANASETPALRVKRI